MWGKWPVLKIHPVPKNSLGRSHKSGYLLIFWWPPRRVNPQGPTCPWISLKLSQDPGSYCLSTRGAKSWETQEPQGAVQQPPSCFPPPQICHRLPRRRKRIQNWAASGGLSCNQGVASSSVEKWVCRMQSKWAGHLVELAPLFPQGGFWAASLCDCSPPQVRCSGNKGSASLPVGWARL